MTIPYPKPTPQIYTSSARTSKGNPFRSSSNKNKRISSRPSDDKRPSVVGFENEMLSSKKLLGNRENDNKFKAVGEASSSSAKDGVEVRVHWSYRPSDDKRPSVVGFENEMLSLKKLLRDRENDKEFKAVGVVGTRGVGKTTLCQEYYLEEGRSKLFLPRVWVSVSKQPNENNKDPKTAMAMLERMLSSLGVEEEKVLNPISSYEDKLKTLLYVLRLQLIGKRYLLVLDDVCELLRDRWDENLHAPVTLINKSGTAGGASALACALPKGCGGKVIVTSRGEETAKKMTGEANVHRVLPLSDPESLWKLFCDTIDKREDPMLANTTVLKDELEKIRNMSNKEFLLGGKKSDIMLDLKKKVIMKSNGLPLTAKLMAETMPELLALWKKQHDASKKDDKVEEEVGKAGLPKETGQIQEKEEGEEEDPEKFKALYKLQTEVEQAHQEIQTN